MKGEAASTQPILATSECPLSVWEATHSSREAGFLHKISWFLKIIIYIVLQQISRAFSSCESETLHPLNNMAATTLLPVSMNLTALGTSYK